MSGLKLTRRNFLVGTAGAAALVGCGGVVGYTAWSKAYADDEEQPSAPPKAVHTVCDGCPNQCGMVARTVEGKLWRVEGEQGHPRSGGRLCGRGQGYASIAYSQDRLTVPLKRNASGGFDPVSWDDALADIARHIKAAKPAEVAVFQARGTDAFFARRFVSALGSANYFTDAAVHDLDVAAAISAIAGTGLPVPDPAHAKYLVMLDASTNDTVLPADADAFAALRDRDAHMVLVDSRITAFSRLADKWVPIIPGTELAFLLGIAGQLIRSGAYDAAFAQACGEGFDQFAAEMKAYRLSWAAAKTGISEGVLGAIASNLAAAAPACYVDMPLGGTFGSGYANSVDVVRMVYLVNALLGNFNQAGGWIFGAAPAVDDAALAAAGIPAVKPGTAAAVDAQAAPLAGGDSCIAAMEAVRAGAVKTAVFVETNPVRDYPAAALVVEALSKLDCLVVCDEFMTETVELADYVLPLPTYLERTDTVQVVPAATSVAALRNQAIERIHPETRTVDEVFAALAGLCGVADAFAFSKEDYNRAVCDVLGVSYEGLVGQGVAAIPSSRVTLGEPPAFSTASGKLLFACPAFADAGLTAVPRWRDPKTSAGKAKPRLLVGEQATQYDTYTIDDEQLMAYAKQYGLDRAWISAELAEKHGIRDGDAVELSTTEATIAVPVKITSCVMPEVVWVPAHYGCTAQQVKQAYGFGAAPKQLISFNLEPATGAAMMNDVTVSIRKAGA
ncbi:molybdopterin-containing oxidoreductase family protein [Xiamenia xianingshaonis]|uniref:Molybdopterin-dependent oxidoreductase n=1 Tax=Xiamenia xianingshaonis TaxID=2682776 RepID=A0A9E6SUD6_9ACTN|nr:molybdopterin-dependent oxidoreductase [Xiamenia xianingshaonis]NHM13894.1 molybdopterin-dependent oxidoreductase [Xiamenia xianingshaonis]QTU84415.1 molybdopterin-dependent oxidoreductase [Xiamenia xianingshaonis]